ncbi:MAG: tetratricopeptide repeat protein [Calditrichaeota bacterium]|nr:tetratricopeptide repeat protein [Calditrichota bacterium]
MKIQFRIIISALLLLANVSLAQQNDAQRKYNEQLLLRARNLEQIGRFDLSLDVYRQLWNNSRTNINYYRGVLNNLIRLGRFAEAESTVKQMLQFTKSDLVQADLGDVYFKMGREDEAFAVWDQILAARPKSQSSYQIVALAMQKNSQFDRAIQVYRLGQKRLKNKRLFLIDMANVYRSQMDYLNAARQYLSYLEAFPKQYSFVESNIISLASNPDYAEDIVKILQERVKKNPKNVQLRHLLAASYFRTANYQAALSEYTAIDEYILTRKKSEKNRLGRELYQFAQNALNDGAFEYALQGFRLVAQRYPKSSYAASAELGIGQCLRRLKQFPEAIAHYERVAVERKNREIEKTCYFRIGEIQLEDLNDPVGAEKSFRRVLNLKPANSLDIQARFRIGDCYIQRDELKPALKWFGQILKRSDLRKTNRMRAKFNQARVNFWLGEFDAAQKIFQEIIDAPIFVPQKNEGLFVNDAIEYVMLIQENSQQKEVLKNFARAELKTEQREFSRAIDILKKMLTSKNGAQMKDRILVKLGEIHFQNKKYASALSDFERVIEEVPQSLLADLAQKRIGDIYAQGFQDKTNAMKAYEHVLVNYPDSIYLEEVREKIRRIEEQKIN